MFYLALVTLSAACAVHVQASNHNLRPHTFSLMRGGSECFTDSNCPDGKQCKQTTVVSGGVQRHHGTCEPRTADFVARKAFLAAVPTTYQICKSQDECPAEHKCAINEQSETGAGVCVSTAEDPKKNPSFGKQCTSDAECNGLECVDVPGLGGRHKLCLK